ncbi:hypothetical protein [Streptomyces sp. 8L]|uniref:hypothetical protein n=1 Tax=Streptomyces sp. 8L TaxID=2877242 RepID=UPI001CD5CE94|nr:hypothetical protein [Streptomyces sp. 8L]MCA1222452.1 hypothetical protein [Streptomyces sp. 8L]
MMTSRIRRALAAGAFLAVAAVTPLVIAHTQGGDTGWTTAADGTTGTSTTDGDTGWSTPAGDTGWSTPGGATVDSLDTGW